MYSIEDAFIKFLNGINDEEVSTFMQEYIAKVRQYQQELNDRDAKLLQAVKDNIDRISKYRPPEEIRRDIKHEKNPMRLKQLNQELNESYKYYKGTKKK